MVGARLRQRLVLPALALLVFPAALAAQGGGRSSVWIGGGGGLGVPIGNFADTYKSGWDVLGMLSLHLANSPVAVRATVQYGEFKQKGNVVFGTLTGKARPIVFTGDIVYRLMDEGSVRPYLFAGAGGASVRYRQNTSTGSIGLRKSGFAWEGGAGLSFVPGSDRYLFFVEGRYQGTPSGDFDYAPFLAGLRIRVR